MRLWMYHVMQIDIFLFLSRFSFENMSIWFILIFILTDIATCLSKSNLSLNFSCILTPISCLFFIGFDSELFQSLFYGLFLRCIYIIISWQFKKKNTKKELQWLESHLLIYYKHRILQALKKKIVFLRLNLCVCF